jgi:hypothetical protein
LYTLLIWRRMLNTVSADGLVQFMGATVYGVEVMWLWLVTHACVVLLLVTCTCVAASLPAIVSDGTIAGTLKTCPLNKALGIYVVEWWVAIFYSINKYVQRFGTQWCLSQGHHLTTHSTRFHCWLWSELMPYKYKKKKLNCQIYVGLAIQTK